jgi:ribonuclease Z
MALLVALCAGLTSCVDRHLEQLLTRADQTLVESPGMHVVLCGTGSFFVDPERAGPCTAVIAAGHVILVDVGPGAWESVARVRVPLASVTDVLLTKFLVEDFGELGEVTIRSWLAGRQDPLAVRGPAGTARLVRDVDDALGLDVATRSARHGAGVIHPERAWAVAYEVDVPPGDGAAVVLEDRGLRVTAFSVGRPEGPPSVGYRFDHRGRSVVVSGHALDSDNLRRHAHGADVLVHEATHPGMVERAIVVMRRLGQTRVAAFAEEMLKTHPGPVDAAEVARAAGVGQLVLTRIAPPLESAAHRWVFMRGVRDVFPETTLGYDGLRVDLAPRDAAVR